MVVDKAVFPREKVCGDGIAPRAVHALYQMGFRQQLEGKYQVIRGVRFHSTHGGITEATYPMGSNFPDHGYIVPRKELDEMLINRIKESDAQVWEGCEVLAVLPLEKGRIPGVRVRLNGKEEEIRAKYIIGADGPSSKVGRDLGLLFQDPRYLGVSVRCYMKGVEDLTDFLEIYPEDAIMPCCGWIFSLGEGVANVGIGGMLYALRKKRVNLNQAFEIFRKKTRYASAKLRNAEMIERLKGAQLRVGLKGSIPGKDNLLLVGDAASMTNPISGEGISYALESGKWAGEAVLGALEGEISDPLASYAITLKERYGDYFHHGWLCIRWGNNPWVMNPLIWVTSKNKRLGNKMGRYLMNVRRRDRPA